jgi:hypothetical protein
MTDHDPTAHHACSPSAPLGVTTTSKADVFTMTAPLGVTTTSKADLFALTNPAADIR